MRSSDRNCKRKPLAPSSDTFRPSYVARWFGDTLFAATVFTKIPSDRTHNCRLTELTPDEPEPSACIASLENPYRFSGQYVYDARTRSLTIKRAKSRFYSPYGIQSVRPNRRLRVVGLWRQTGASLRYAYDVMVVCERREHNRRVTSTRRGVFFFFARSVRNTLKG